ncbi:hypothetical protein [Myxococcus stipitatus]|nr:hypothetical protein [Myxococcus stipitatus]
MSGDVRSEIQRRWQSSEVLQIDGILFGAGELILMDYTVVMDSGTKQEDVFVSPIARSSLQSVLEFNDDPWVSVTSLGSCEWPERGERLFCGEGSMGNEGFVASCATSSGQLRWVAFFTRSNPFLSVRVVDGFIVATSSHWKTWSFPPEHPERVRVER